MNKIVFFVEGQTEQIFLDRFLQEYLSIGNFNYTPRALHQKNIIRVQFDRTFPDAKFDITIINIGNDEKVLSFMLEFEKANREKEEFSHFIGLRDLFPKQKSDAVKIVDGANRLFSDLPNTEKIKLFLAVMEIEAWFFIDADFFKDVDPVLTTDYINEKLAIDLTSVHPESHAHPSALIDKIYQFANLRYHKREKQSYKIAHTINYNKLACSTEVDSWNTFFQFIESIFQ